MILSESNLLSFGSRPSIPSQKNTYTAAKKQVKLINNGNSIL